MKKLIENIEKGIKEKCTPSVAYGIIDREKELGIVLLDSRIHPSRNNPKFRDFRKNLNDGIYEELNKDVDYDDIDI